ncbi:hypothetical protein MMC30_001908 [Trapelia coarctata]|nr:hypothetical protein [Trapelia coarctata]
MSVKFETRDPFSKIQPNKELPPYNPAYHSSSSPFTKNALRALATFDDGGDYAWSYTPALPLSYYLSHGLSSPAPALPITPVRLHKSYIVKLECLGCPFRVRELGPVVETWQEPPQANSLLLNFTLSSDAHSLLLNGRQIFPLPPPPVRISAFQTPANLSGETMQHIISTFARFELSYAVTTFLATRLALVLQFDITNVDIAAGSNQDGAALSHAGQELVQLRLGWGVGGVASAGGEPPLEIQQIALLPRSQRAQPPTLPCGNTAPVYRTVFRATEWDYYGQQGTWRRMWRLFSWTLERAFVDALPGFVIMGIASAVGYLARRVRMRWVRARRGWVGEGGRDAEAAGALMGEEGGGEREREVLLEKEEEQEEHEILLEKEELEQLLPEESTTSCWNK